ncbi:MFS transporter [Aneurinibacillus sp. Ricciae_BoGa-3]|uniref:MFS transporter n=1 Tax=Aneurinibacillus sp. Ricciae_BoGa-3 TaxID=3022697 RepID=UPI00233F9D81|nr:MFS transporter [Aneurinibacillus sp. Ricciae_BoGa-3]WCK55081.1 MFS transporter [Aneurinibacillus sp. Ricciae_BoGa-3]
MSDIEHQLHPVKEKKPILSILALCSFFIGLDSIITVPLIPLMTESIHISMNMGALLVTAYAFVYMICAPLFGTISDQCGRKKMICSGMLFLGLGTALLGIGRDFNTLLLLRAITGMGAGMLQPNVLAYISDHYSYEQRGRVMGIIMAAMTSSTILGVPLGSYFAQVSSWRWTYLTIGLLGMALVLGIYTVIPADNTGKEPSSRNFSLRRR